MLLLSGPVSSEAHHDEILEHELFIDIQPRFVRARSGPAAGAVL